MTERREVTAEGDADYATQPVDVAGHALVADASGALWWPAERTLIVADLHFEKGSAFAARGLMLPPYDTRETLGRLARAIAAHRPARVVALGDSLHDRGAESRIADEDRAEIARLQRRREWIWITGNHDPEIAPTLGGEVLVHLSLGGLCLRHEPGAEPVSRDDDAASAGEIAGHLHPAARVALRGGTMRRPCFVGDGRRLILPAFGALTGGLNVLDAAFAPLITAGTRRVWMLGTAGVYPVPVDGLLGD